MSHAGIEGVSFDLLVFLAPQIAAYDVEGETIMHREAISKPGAAIHAERIHMDDATRAGLTTEAGYIGSPDDEPTQPERTTPDWELRALAVLVMAGSTIAATLVFGVPGLIIMWMVLAYGLLRRF